MKSIYLKNYFGQSMIEVIVALTLIIMFLSGVVAVEIVAIRNSEYARNKSVATNYARQQLERARVVRDSVGIDSLYTSCISICYLNNKLSPAPTPTGIFAQNLKLENATLADCPPAPVPIGMLTPTAGAKIYKATANVYLAHGSGNITPTPLVVMRSCLTDWR